MNENLKNIWSVNLVIENYRLGFPKKYAQYKNLIHDLIKTEINELRNDCLNKARVIPNISDFVNHIDNQLNLLIQGSIKTIINATGIIINTNLGRVPISENTLNNIKSINENYFNLEYDLKTSERHSRQNHYEYLLKILTGAESALIVNNTAAALFLVCNTFSKDKNGCHFKIICREINTNKFIVFILPIILL